MALAVKRDARMGVAEDMRWLKPCWDEGRGDVLDGAEGVAARGIDGSFSTVARSLDAMARERGCGAYPGLAIRSAAIDDDAPG
ncbi:hypothetical protein [Methylobacterium sp. 1973]|uniref:hypothetical protein n=1 Tax=Methylobacterium sp. 1973 TaxID=3156421 RepID=UPI003398BE72